MKNNLFEAVQQVVDGKYENNYSENILATLPEKKKKKMEKEENITGKSITAKVYPNPNNGRFNLDINGDEGDAFIYFF